MMTVAGKGVFVSLSPGAVAVDTPYVSPEIAVFGAGGSDDNMPFGFFSLDITFTGSGRTLAATLLVSNGTSFVAYEGASPIFTGKSAGHIFAAFAVPVCRAFEIVLTATTDTCTVTECIVAMA